MRLTFVTACLLLVTAAAATPALAQTAVVTGLVLDRRGEPIEGAVVTAESTEFKRTLEATTNGSGRFSFIGLQGGLWLFIAHATGYESSQTVAPVRRAGAGPRLQFTLDLDPLRPPIATTGVLANISPADLETELVAAHTLYDKGQYDAAIEAYRALLTRVPSLTTINLQIGHAYREKRDLIRARQAYQAVLDDEPDNEEARKAIRQLDDSAAK